MIYDTEKALLLLMDKAKVELKEQDFDNAEKLRKENPPLFFAVLEIGLWMQTKKKDVLSAIKELNKRQPKEKNKTDAASTGKDD